MSLISIIIPTVNKTDLLKICISSVISKTKDLDYEIIIVDDGSTKKVKDFIDATFVDSKIKIVHKNNNTGFADTCNHGISKSSGEIIILVNNDTEFRNDICEIVRSIFEKDNRIGIIGNLLLYPNNTIQHAGMELRADRSFYHIDKHQSINKLRPSRFCPAVTGAIFALRKKCIDEVGILDSSYFIACDDTDYCLRAWNKDWKVWYENSAVAIHLEGATRGKDEASKRKISDTWKKKEQDSISLFNKKFINYDFNSLQYKINELNKSIQTKNKTNNSVKKIEIGSGNNPQVGYIHIDSRRLPGTDHVLNFETQKLPFPNGDIDEILSNHCIEHISWRSLPFVFREWHRVLKPGGRVFLRTPDLEFICKMYLSNKTTPEWPADERFITDNLSKKVTPSWWANIKLFAGQDYSENYHCLCFDFEMLRETVERFGFRDVKRLSVQPVYSPGEIQAEFFK